jgi:regulatory protein
MLALPWPVASPVSCTHVELLVADHVQSRVVLTVSVPVPPPEGMLAVMEFATETWHFATLGDVTPRVLEVQERVRSAPIRMSEAPKRMRTARRVQIERRQQDRKKRISCETCAYNRPAAPNRSHRITRPMDAYADGLKMLARRELSEFQVRQRLARKGHAVTEVEAAIERLRAERAIDDARVAEAIARTEVSVRRRGKLRVRMQIERAGIARATAKHATDEAFTDVDDESLLQAALARRLRSRETIDDDRERQRLYRYLVGQGFDPDRVIRALDERRQR